MTPRHPDAATGASTDLFREQLDTMLNQRHELYWLADLVDGSVFDKEFGCAVLPGQRLSGETDPVNGGVALSDALLRVIR